MVLKEKIAIVTGSGSGIGEEIAAEFARQGARVAIADINAPAAQRVVEKIERSSGKAMVLEVDICDPQKVKAAAARVVEAFGTIDILVNCAGFNQFVAVEDVTPELWERIRSINLDGSWNFASAVLPVMMKRRRGKIINIGSAAAVKAIPKALPYVVSKHAIVGLTRALAVDLGPYNINVNCICPGPVETPLLEKSTSATFQQQIAATLPLGRLGKPSDIAQAAVFLASSASDWITGVVLPADGGLVSCVRAHHWE